MKKIIVLIFISMYALMQAQQDPRVIVFNADDKKKSASTGDEMNILKIGLAEMFLGDYSLFFERGLTDYFSVEIGAGLTSRSNPSIGPFSFTFLDDFVDTDIVGRMGNSLSAGFRIYPDYVLEDFYFSVDVKRRVYSWENSFYQTPEPVRESYSVLYPRISSGQSVIVGDKVVIDYFGGVGFAKIKRNAYDWNTEDISTTESQTLWFHLGLRLGLLF
jgi:hypothetical protein